jgi:hypothetical protein
MKDLDPANRFTRFATGSRCGLSIGCPAPEKAQGRARNARAAFGGHAPCAYSAAGQNGREGFEAREWLQSPSQAVSKARRGITY